MLDALEQRITDLLSQNGANSTQIEMYLDDIFSFSDRRLYIDASDQDILNDFDQWLEEDRKSTRLNSSHVKRSRMPSSA